MLKASLLILITKVEAFIFIMYFGLRTTVCAPQNNQIRPKMPFLASHHTKDRSLYTATSTISFLQCSSAEKKKVHIHFTNKCMNKKKKIFASNKMSLVDILDHLLWFFSLNKIYLLVQKYLVCTLSRDFCRFKVKSCFERCWARFCNSSSCYTNKLGFLT